MDAINLNDVAKVLDVVPSYLENYLVNSDLTKGKDYLVEDGQLFLHGTGLIGLSRILSVHKFDEIVQMILTLHSDQCRLNAELAELKTVTNRLGEILESVATKPVAPASVSQQIVEKIATQEKRKVGRPKKNPVVKAKKAKKGRKATRAAKAVKTSKNLPETKVFRDSINRMHEKRKMANGLEAEIVVYNGTNDVTVRFVKDRVVRIHRQYSTYLKGEISNDASLHSETDVIDALFGYYAKGGYYLSPSGRAFATKQELCSAYGFTEQAVYQAIKTKHISFEEYLCQDHPKVKKHNDEVPEVTVDNVPAIAEPAPQESTKTAELLDAPVKDPSIKVPVSYVTEAKALKLLFGHDDISLPSLDEDEIKWAIQVCSFMKSGKLAKAAMNTIKKKVYVRMRDVYGVVLYQAATEYKSKYDIDSDVSYLRVIAQTHDYGKTADHNGTDLASLFKAILIDYMNGDLEL